MIEEIQEEDEKEAYAIWKYGMSTDLTQLWLLFFLKQTFFKIFLGEYFSCGNLIRICK